jgi:Arc/MetJ-type ribon-helix-helix transcriptional regulator
MTIHVSQDVENSIHAAVLSGRFASVDDAMEKAARLLLRELEHEAQEQKIPANGATEQLAGQGIDPTRKPLWQRAAELRARVPAEEWAKLPIDGASQHDHYIYGTPKRPAS